MIDTKVRKTLIATKKQLQLISICGIINTESQR